MTTPHQIIAGRYRVVRELGRGGMGAVYLVEHVHTGEQLALKVLLAKAGASPDLVARFKREARAPARIKSDHVVKIVDADVAPELDGAPFMVMELLEGASLEDYLTTRSLLTPEETISILRELAIALDKAHAIGIVHRDLKPENIFLHNRDQGRVVKLLDFGISKLTDDAGDIKSAGLTKTGAVMGTPLYMAPEQARGASNITAAVDIWALGLIAHRMLTGKIYWTADSLAVLMSELIALPMDPPSTRTPGLSLRFDAWFARSCDRDPTARFASVGEQVGALAAALGTTSEPCVPSGFRRSATSVPSLGDSAAQSASTSVPSFPSTGPIHGAGTNDGISNTRTVPAKSRPPVVVVGAIVVSLVACGIFVATRDSLTNTRNAAALTPTTTPLTSVVLPSSASADLSSPKPSFEPATSDTATTAAGKKNVPSTKEPPPKPGASAEPAKPVRVTNTAEPGRPVEPGKPVVEPPAPAVEPAKPRAAQTAYAPSGL